jgi:hypothetical protein
MYKNAYCPVHGTPKPEPSEPNIYNCHSCGARNVEYTHACKVEAGVNMTVLGRAPATTPAGTDALEKTDNVHQEWVPLPGFRDDWQSSLSEAIRAAFLEAVPGQSDPDKEIGRERLIHGVLRHIQPVLRDAMAELKAENVELSNMIRAADRRHAEELAVVKEEHCRAICNWCSGKFSPQEVALRKVKITDGMVRKLWWHGTDFDGVQCKAAVLRSLDTAALLAAHEERIRAEARLEEARIWTELALRTGYCNTKEQMARLAELERAAPEPRQEEERK